MDTNPPADRLLNATTDELFELLGRELAGQQAFPLGPGELIERAQGWFSAQTDTIRSAICIPSVARNVVAESDQRALLLMLADILMKMQLDVAPLTLSALVLKIGLKKFCNWP